MERFFFYEILNLAQNEERLHRFMHGNKKFEITLKRGQCIFPIAKYARELLLDRRSAQRFLENLSKWYTEMHIESKPFGLIVTIKNYDELTKMYSEMHIERTSNVQPETRLYKNEERERGKRSRPRIFKQKKNRVEPSSSGSVEHSSARKGGTTPHVERCSDGTDSVERSSARVEPSSPQFLLAIPDKLAEGLGREFSLTSQQIKQEGKKALAYLRSEGKTKKDYKAYLYSWLSKIHQRESGGSKSIVREAFEQYGY